MSYGYASAPPSGSYATAGGPSYNQGNSYSSGKGNYGYGNNGPAPGAYQTAGGANYNAGGGNPITNPAAPNGGGKGAGDIWNAVKGAIPGVLQAGANNASWNQVAQGLNNGINTMANANTGVQTQLAPTIANGAVGQNTLKNVAANGTTQADVNSYFAPGMNFAMGQGQAAIERSAASRGGNMNSGALQDISSYITGQASQNYNNAAGLAQNSTGQQIQAGTGLTNAGLTANEVSANTNTGVAANIAAAQANKGNAYGQGISGSWGALNGVSPSNSTINSGGSSSGSSGGGGGGGGSGLGQALSVVGTIASFL